MIALIVAQSKNHVIGNNNDLPWHLPADLKHFKETTTGHTVIMGRNTYDSIFKRLNGPLPNRRNIVISRSLKDNPEGFELFDSLDKALAAVPTKETAFIIGGATIYKESLEKGKVDEIYLTQVHTEIDGDAFFPELDNDKWKEVKREDIQAGEKNCYDYSFILLRKV